jgi:hypothetical protein
VYEYCTLQARLRVRVLYATSSTTCTSTSTMLLQAVLRQVLQVLVSALQAEEPLAECVLIRLGVSVLPFSSLSLRIDVNILPSGLKVHTETGLFRV